MPVSWADVSYYQPAVDDSYPYPVLCIRSNDGTFRDPKFQDPRTGKPGPNWVWARQALDSGRLSALIVYTVYRPNWEQTANVMIDMVGTPPHPKIVAMIDVESWGGQISGDHSGNINRMYWKLAEWLGDRRRVIGYGNRGDLDSIWPVKPEGVRLIVASYPKRPNYPGMIGHQFSSSHPIAPFGQCDANTAYDIELPEFLNALGLSGGTTVRAEEDEDVSNHIIKEPGGLPLKGRIVLGCPTGDLAANKRKAWLSAILIDLHGPAWVQVFAQGASGGRDQWRWTENDLRARNDNFLPRAVREIPPETSHLIVSWDLSSAPEGGTLMLETRPTT